MLERGEVYETPVTGERAVVRVGAAETGGARFHDRWNAGEVPAQVRVEIEPAARFEAAIRNAFCLAQDGRTDRKGMPDLFQLALFALEFDDVIRFARPPRLLQRLLFLALAPVARWRGYLGRYPEYLARPPNAVMEVVED